MTIAQELDIFIKNTNQHVFIEAEGKPDRINLFIRDYNSQFSPIINAKTSGIIKLQEDANKWGLELRLYLYDVSGVPNSIEVTRNKKYRNEYPYRINDIEIIMELFKLGYRIGIN